MKIAVALQTCDRADYTARTLDSFSAQHPDARDRFVLLHGDDGSTTPRNRELAAAHGFETVVAHRARKGARVLRAALGAAVLERNIQWLLLLENDWEWVRPFPWAAFEFLVATRGDVYTLRLYGDYKGRNGRYRCSTQNLGRPARKPLPWWRVPGAPEAIEIGRMHWGAPPAVTRIEEFTRIHQLTAGNAEVGDLAECVASGRIDRYAARVVENCVFHIGDERTKPVRPAGRAARPAPYTKDWQARRRWTIPGAIACFDRALALLTPVPRSVLDVGCGEGAVVRQAQQQYKLNALGVDLSLSAPDGPLRGADLRQPLALDRTFDWVICWEVAEHLPADAADTLCDSLVRHLAPGGVLLFTAAQPGQGGDGHLNEQPLAYWRERFEARGLAFRSAETETVARAWRKAAPRQPWYSNNLIVCTAPGVREPEPLLARPRVAITMRTADRSPNPNYVGATVRRLIAQGIPPADLHLCPTSPSIEWLARQLDGLPVTVHVPDRVLTPNENGLAQIRAVAGTDADAVLLLEDDLEFCADFLPSVQRWFRKHARPNRHLYRLFGFRVHPPHAHIRAYDTPLDRSCAGSQAVLLRMADAKDFVAWADKNLAAWGGFRGNARIAFDKLLAAWINARWPREPGVMSHPFLVRHVGDVSSLHPKAIRNDAHWRGPAWRYA